MRKKGRAAVPDWLNSPMWSVPQPPPAPPDPYGADLAPPATPPLKPAAPAVPPPPSYAEAVGERRRRRRGQDVHEEEDGLAGAVIRAHLLADFNAAVGFSSRSG
jgi:TBC1 domain family member 13